MLTSITSFFGIISVEELNGVITVSGVRSRVIYASISKYLDSTRLSKNMFEYGSHSFSFFSFFAPDVLFTIEKLIEYPKIGISVNTLNKIKTLLLENTYLKKLKEPVPKILDRSKLSHMVRHPLDYQEELFNLYEENLHKYSLNGFLFAGTAGSGKTYTSLAVSECLDVDQVIIVCPIAALRRVWEDNLLHQFKNPPTYWISDSNKPMKGDERFIIVHYEYLEKLLDSLYLLKGKKMMIIPDESHNLNETTSWRTNYFISLCKVTKSKHVLWLSGTPIKAMALEAIPLIRCIDPLFTPDAEEKFRKIYKGDNTKAVEILNNRLGFISFKVGKERLNLKPPIFTPLKISFKGSEIFTLVEVKNQMRIFVKGRQEAYALTKEKDHAFYFECLELYKKTLTSQADIAEFNKYNDDIDTIVTTGSDLGMVKDEIVFCNGYENRKIVPALPDSHRKRFKDVKSIYKYLRLKIQGECLGLVVSRARINCHIEMAKHIDYDAIIEATTKKTVIFTSFTEVIESVEIAVKKLEFNPVTVYGKTSSNLNELVGKFEKQENVNPLIATYATLSTAVPLTMADNMLLIDVPFRDYILQQAVSRIHRLGSDTQTNVYTATLDTAPLPNISTRTTDILKWSQQQTADILGIKSPFELEDTMADNSVVGESYGTGTMLYLDEIDRYQAKIDGDIVTESIGSIPVIDWVPGYIHDSSVYYHGSPNLIEGYLEPRSSEVIKGKKAVFATDRTAAALSFCAPWNDDYIMQGTVNGKLYMKEMKRGAFDRLFIGKPGYIYVVAKDGFKSERGLTKFEFINSAKVKIHATYYVADIWKALIEEDVELHPFGKVVF